MELTDPSAPQTGGVFGNHTENSLNFPVGKSVGGCSRASATYLSAVATVFTSQRGLRAGWYEGRANEWNNETTIYNLTTYTQFIWLDLHDCWFYYHIFLQLHTSCVMCIVIDVTVAILVLYSIDVLVTMCWGTTNSRQAGTCELSSLITYNKEKQELGLVQSNTLETTEAANQGSDQERDEAQGWTTNQVARWGNTWAAGEPIGLEAIGKRLSWVGPMHNRCGQQACLQDKTGVEHREETLANLTRHRKTDQIQTENREISSPDETATIPMICRPLWIK